MPSDLSVARTILEQLGGSRFLAMTGAVGLIGDPRSMTFRIPLSRGINNVVVELDRGTDTYTVVGYRLKGHNCNEVQRHALVYADALQVVFTAMTGLDTHL